MDRGELHAAVARAIVELPGADVSWRPDWDEAADAAIRVVLAEAERTVREFPLNICGYGAPMPADHAASVEQFREAVLMALVPPPPSVIRSGYDI